MAIKKNFTLLGVPTIPANANFLSDAIEISFNYVWVISPVSVGIVGGPPTYTIEVSADGGVTWVTYVSTITGLPASGIAITQDSIDDDIIYTSMRINYSANGTTAGTVEFPINLKSK